VPAVFFPDHTSRHSDVDHFLQVLHRSLKLGDHRATLTLDCLGPSRSLDLHRLLSTNAGPGIHFQGLREAAVGLATAGLRSEAVCLVRVIAPHIRSEQLTPWRATAFINDLVHAGVPQAALEFFELHKTTLSRSSDALLNCARSSCCTRAV